MSNTTLTLMARSRNGLVNAGLATDEVLQVADLMRHALQTAVSRRIFPQNRLKADALAPGEPLISRTPSPVMTLALALDRRLEVGGRS
jgi:hypothetical protein